MKHQNGFSIISLLVIAVIIGLIGGVGWLVYDRQGSQEQKTNSSQEKKDISSEGTQTKQPTTNAGWKVYESQKLGISFEYPEGWFVREEDEISTGNRVYVSNHGGIYDKGNAPADYQNIWLSTWDQETSVAQENAVAQGSPGGTVISGSVTATGIQAGDITIGTYEYRTVGGPALEAFWTSKGKRYYATNATETQNQNQMVELLKNLLPTVKAL